MRESMGGLENWSVVITWYQAIDAKPCGCWTPLLVGAVYPVAVLIVCCVVKGHLLPILGVRPCALFKVLQNTSSIAKPMHDGGEKDEPAIQLS